MPKPKVSIVVPIYNVEKYLCECVDSLLAQTLKDIEIILVDDGSPDKCGEIVDEYAKKDPRIVAVHQKNSGYSVAVNKGIDMARGEYIGIIESDDWVEPDMYKTLYNNAHKNNTDITKGGFFLYNSTLPPSKQNIYYANSSGSDLRLAPSGVFKITDWTPLLSMHASIWSSIYKSDFIKKIKIPETAGASYQDFPFLMLVMTKAKRITVEPKAFVHWRNDPDQGNSTSANGKKLLLMAENSKTALGIVKKSGLYEELKESLYVHIIWANLGFLNRIQWKYKREYYEKMRDIFLPLIKDRNFKGVYFTPTDKTFFKLITTSKSYEEFIVRHYGAAFIRKAKRAPKKILSLLCS